MSAAGAAGTYLLGDLDVTRLGYGAMQLAGRGVFGPPADRGAALAVLREAVRLGVTHIDTSDYYGPTVTNELIREALHPYPPVLHIVTKVGARRDERGGWLPAFSRDELRRAVHDNLEHLGLDRLDVVKLRLMDDTGTDGTGERVARPFAALAELQDEGLVRHLGLSNATASELRLAAGIAPVVCVQNMYNIAHRDDDALLDELAAQGVAYVPFFPLGGFSPLQSAALDAVARRLRTAPMTVALAWLLRRSPNILLIPGTSSVEQLRQNLAAAQLELPDDAAAELDRIGAPGGQD